jgi:hypothetical protein
VLAGRNGLAWMGSGERGQDRKDLSISGDKGVYGEQFRLYSLAALL